MKRNNISILAILGCLATGCDTDIDMNELDFNAALSAAELCVLSGGLYDLQMNNETGKQEGFCYCGTGEKENRVECGKNVNCRVNGVGEAPVCGGTGYTFLTEGLCTLNGVEVCAERIGLDGKAIGYSTKCENNRWTEEKVCTGQNSCQIYLFNGQIMSSKCGECQNDGTTCVGGKIVN